MANNYFSRTTFIPFTIAESSQVNEFNGNVDTAFDKLPPPLSTGKGFSKNFKVTEEPTLNEHVVRVEEAQSNSLSYAVDTTGTGNNYTVTLSVAPSSYKDGLTVKFKALKTNTTTSYLNVNGLGNVEIIKSDGTSLTGSEIKQDYIHEVTYNNGRFQLISQTNATAPEAPIDGEYYSRRNGSWQSIDDFIDNGSYAYDRSKNTAVFNLVSDPNFSKTTAGSDLTYWNQSSINIEWDNTGGFDSSPCMKFTSNGTNLYADSQAQATVIYTPALDTDNFYLRFRAKKDSSFNGTVELRLSLFDANYALLSYNTLSVASGDLTTSYAMFTGIATLSETNVAFISVSIGIPNSSTTGTAYIDDVLVSRAINWDDGLVVGSNRPSDNADITYDETAGRGANIANARYSSFEERALPPLTVSNKNTSLDTTLGYFGDTSYKFTTTSTSNYTYFGESDTDYNIKLTPNKTWIISAYIYSDTLTDVSIGIKTATATTNTTTSITATSAWQRIYGRINLNLDNNQEGIIKLSCNSGSATINVDAIMLEEAVGGQSEPSSYVDPAMYSGATYIQGEYTYDRGYETAGFNLITDPNINKTAEDGAIGRYWSAWNLDTTGGVDGSACLRWDYNEQRYNTVRVNSSVLYIPAIQGEKFYIRVRIKRDSSFDGGHVFTIRELDKDKSTLSDRYLVVSNADITTSYTTHDGIITLIEANCAFISLFMQPNSFTAGSLYADDILVSRAINWDTAVVTGSTIPEDNATVGATWDDNITNQPDDIIISNMVTLRDTFERDPSDTTNVWVSYNGSGELSSGTGESGGKSLKIGNNSGNDQRWLICNQNMPYDPNTLYEVGITIKRTAGTGTCYVGVAGVAADGTTFVNRSGGDSYGSQHYITLTNSDVASSFTTYKGYIQGSDSSGSFSAHNDPSSPGVLHEDAKYIRGLIIVNYGSVAGTHEIDEFWIRPVNLVTVWNDIYSMPADEILLNSYQCIGAYQQVDLPSTDGTPCSVDCFINNNVSSGNWFLVAKFDLVSTYRSGAWQGLFNFGSSNGRFNSQMRVRLSCFTGSTGGSISSTTYTYSGDDRTSYLKLYYDSSGTVYVYVSLTGWHSCAFDGVWASNAGTGNCWIFTKQDDGDAVSAPSGYTEVIPTANYTLGADITGDNTADDVKYGSGKAVAESGADHTYSHKSDDVKYGSGKTVAQYGADKTSTKTSLNTTKVNDSTNDSGNSVDIYGNLRLNSGVDVEFYTGDAQSGATQVGGIDCDSSYGLAVKAISKYLGVHGYDGVDIYSSNGNVSFDAHTGGSAISHIPLKASASSSSITLGTSTTPWYHIYGTNLTATGSTIKIGSSSNHFTLELYDTSDTYIATYHAYIH